LESLLGKDTLNRLLVSLKTPKKWRKMDPIEIAENLKILCDHFPRDEVARRLGISEKGTLWVYLRLLDLPEKVQELVRTKKVGKDAAYRVSIRLNKKEQEDLAEAIIKYKLNSSEVKGITQSLKKRNRNMPIGEAIALTLKARPSVTEQHIVVTRIEEDTLEALKRKSEDQKTSIQELIKKSLGEILPSSSLTSLRMIDRMVFLSLDEESFKVLKDRAREKQIKLENLVDTLAKREACT
jgi:hypothetical protein